MCVYDDLLPGGVDQVKSVHLSHSQANQGQCMQATYTFTFLSRPLLFVFLSSAFQATSLLLHNQVTRTATTVLPDI